MRVEVFKIRAPLRPMTKTTGTCPLKSTAFAGTRRTHKQYGTVEYQVTGRRMRKTISGRAVIDFDRPERQLRTLETGC